MHKSDFPIFTAHPSLVYLDSAASAQKPSAVIDAVSSFYKNSYAPIHRGLYPLAVSATEAYESARKTIAEFIGANERETVFTRSATESINLVAASFPWSEGDEIVVSELEHHANMIPWQQAAQAHGLKISYAGFTPEGDIDLAHLRSLVTSRTRVVSATHCSNVFGRFTPASTLKKILSEQGSDGFVLLDA